MADVTVFDAIRELYDYHRWANRCLFDVASALGEETASRDMGRHFSLPTLTRMLAHVYGADAIWLSRWQGQPMGRIPGGDIPTLAALRERWDPLEREQRAFIERLTPADLTREIAYNNLDGIACRVPLWPLLQHVPNHATHHRSELATMITLISKSPPDTGLVRYHLVKTGQIPA
jgi:uncharacterized damage-inducible protein DinB